MFSSKENVFLDKFQLLNSQEASEEISWSSSECSDYENASPTEKPSNNRKPLKRKRKTKSLKNISNLDITITDNSKDVKQSFGIESSSTSITKQEGSCGIMSPVLHVPNSSKHKLGPNQSEPGNSITSPVLLQRFSSPKLMSATKKKLFKEEDSSTVDNFMQESPATHGKTSPVLKLKSLVHKKTNSMEDKSLSGEILFNQDNIELVQEFKTETEDRLNDSFSILKTNRSTELAKRVRSFFDNNFSSGSQTEQSISNSVTPEKSTKSSEDIEIISSLTQQSRQSSFLSVKLEPVSQSPKSYESTSPIDIVKKMRYKKDGLAYRLDRLLKKHLASVSLWQHEKFLAANSNFIMPKGECLLFHIRNVQFKYGLYLLDTRDVNDVKSYILVNSNSVNSDKFMPNTVFKLYKPFSSIDYEKDVKLIINVSKFENVCL